MFDDRRENFIQKAIYDFEMVLREQMDRVDRMKDGGDCPYCDINKGVTIGQENRGKRKGTPVIGDEVWIGINATIVGKVSIGSDVLIAPNTFVNKDIPDHSVVFGNPCVIIPNTKATEEYICNKA